MLLRLGHAIPISLLLVLLLGKKQHHNNPFALVTHHVLVGLQEATTLNLLACKALGAKGHHLLCLLLGTCYATCFARKAFTWYAYCKQSNPCSAYCLPHPYAQAFTGSRKVNFLLFIKKDFFLLQTKQHTKKRFEPPTFRL